MRCPTRTLCHADAAQRIFKSMPNRDAMTWNSVMAGLVQNGMMLQDALNCSRTCRKETLQGYVNHGVGGMAVVKSWFEKMPKRSELHGTS